MLCQLARMVTRPGEVRPAPCRDRSETDLSKEENGK